MKLQLLPSTFDETGCASARQHLSCFVIDDCVAIDAGSLAMATNAAQKKQIRDVILTHAHLDHIAGLPLFIDDLFAGLTEPIRVFATSEVIEVIERDIFNWSVYPSFSELSNKNGAVLEYHPFRTGEEFSAKHLRVKAVEVNHKVPTVGFIISDAETNFALSSDTAEMDGFWEVVNAEKNLAALFVECSFPNELEELAQVSHHLTPKALRKELNKFNQKICPIYVINIKPMYFDEVVRQVAQLNIENLKVLKVGQVYNL
ncbi:MAG: 3',5'-cyclic-nucleotide phosphodiesterase [Acidobacteriota bacterium]|nr:3',5'-cyclic-nucleotide phosphodiesterase [Acidobacteriota bacterium]